MICLLILLVLQQLVRPYIIRVCDSKQSPFTTKAIPVRTWMEVGWLHIIKNDSMAMDVFGIPAAFIPTGKNYLQKHKKFTAINSRNCSQRICICLLCRWHEPSSNSKMCSILIIRSFIRKPAYWVDDHAMERFFDMHQGVVTVKEHGLYYIYAQVRPILFATTLPKTASNIILFEQIFYHDDHDTNGYIIEHNSEPLYQCTTATHSNQRVTKSNTCHTAGINYLNAGDKIHIKDLGSHRYTLFDAAKSFFGLIKVGDLRGSGNNYSTSSSINT